MRTKLFISLALGLGLTLALLWLLGGATLPPAHAAASQCPDQRPLLQAGGAITVCLSGGCDYTSIQDAVDAADPGDEILVAAGTYTDVNNYGGLAQVVYISKTVTIRGGYTTTNWTAPYPITQPTTLDAQRWGRVLYITGSISPTIEGLRITGGDATGLGGNPWGDDAGGGVYVISATATISNNQVFSNTAYRGGGLWLHCSNATSLSGNTIISNIADFGGGLYLENGDATLSSNTVISNTAKEVGGGLVVIANAALSGNTVISNTAEMGGGLALAYRAATLTNTVIVGNQANTTGSGLFIYGASPRLLHTTIARNSGGDGSGVYVTDDGLLYSTVALTNTILVSHTVGITVTSDNTVTLEATLWGTDTWANFTDWDGTGAIITGTHNYWGAPTFVDPNTGDYHIGATSAAIDQGVNAGGTTDIDGDARPDGCLFDIGADEFITGVACKRIYLPLIMRQYL